MTLEFMEINLTYQKIVCRFPVKRVYRCEAHVSMMKMHAIYLLSRNVQHIYILATDPQLFLFAIPISQAGSPPQVASNLFNLVESCRRGWQINFLSVNKSFV